MLGRAVGLLAVTVDEGVEVVEAVVPASHGRLPGRALLQLSIGKQVEDAGITPVEIRAWREANELRGRLLMRDGAWLPVDAADR